MFRGIFEFWYELPIFLRATIALLLIGISVVTFFFGDIWITPGVIGLVLLFFCGAGGNNSGYNF